MALIRCDRPLHLQIFRAQGPTATGADDLAMLLLQMLWVEVQKCASRVDGEHVYEKDMKKLLLVAGWCQRYAWTGPK